MNQPSERYVDYVYRQRLNAFKRWHYENAASPNMPNPFGWQRRIGGPQSTMTDSARRSRTIRRRTFRGIR